MQLVVRNFYYYRNKPNIISKKNHQSKILQLYMHNINTNMFRKRMKCIYYRNNFCRYSYCIGSECKLQLALSAHDQACRTVQFISDGKKVCTASKDASLKVFNLETVEELHLLKNSNGY